MKFQLFGLAGATASALASAAATAQPMEMPGMNMPAAPNPAPKDEARARPVVSPPQHHVMDRQAMPMPVQAGSEIGMTGAFGSYPMQRESSGTSWQPDASERIGAMTTSGGWMLMGHGLLNLVYDHQSGTRGSDKVFASGMLMGMAQHSLGDGTLQVRAMVSPDPLMGPDGYPLLLASGETANGHDPLIDRQHPHDFVMELSVSVSQSIGRDGSLFLYAGLPGEPAFGPPAFMHREAIMDSPEAPISHHWLDSTHISFGVATAGIVLGHVKLEASRFNGREPDQHRWNVEAGPLDSTSVRLSWNPSANVSLQGSWGHFVDPEQLEPGINQRRLSASLLYAREMAKGMKFAATLAWGRKTVEHHADDAYVGEASLKEHGWTLFGRGEMAENRELLGLGGQLPAYRVGKISIGAVRDFRIAEHLAIGVGSSFSLNFVPHPLALGYGSSNPIGLMNFVRLKAD